MPSNKRVSASKRYQFAFALNQLSVGLQAFGIKGTGKPHARFS
jgi:hypothetical protein